MKTEVPPYLSPGQIARACKISRYRAFNELKGAKILEYRSGRWRVSRSRLCERLPEMFDDVVECFEAAAENRVGAP